MLAEENPRILISRTDRVGDLVLSTPVFFAIKERYPKSFVAALVFKETALLLEGHPSIDQVIVYDKKGRHRSSLETIFFALRLRKLKFDIAIHLHPTNRAHFISFLAKIPARIGYRSKNHTLLTQTLPETKWQGTRHEAEYNFDLLRLIDVPIPKKLQLFAPKHEQVGADLIPSRNFAVFHPSASGPSKMWPPKRFAEVADRLVRDHALMPVIVGGHEASSHALEMECSMETKPINLVGRLGLKELSGLLRRAQILISNDSGPVHMAASVETPVLSIFGRNQAGLSATRWRPISKNSIFVQKEVGCIECFAHKCTIGFKCLYELTVDEVTRKAEELLAKRFSCHPHESGDLEFRLPLSRE
jgi:heptosyltransferase II